MPEIRTAYLFAAKIATIFETTKFVGHNFLFNVSAILPKKIRDLRDFRDLKDFKDFRALRNSRDLFFWGG